jgi:GMP synthase (glutamine-hydrolysing)
MNKEINIGRCHLPILKLRIKKNIYGTQFHPEADVEEFILRIHTYKNYGYFPPEKAVELISAMKDKKAPDTKEILRRFVQKYTK